MNKKAILLGVKGIFLLLTAAAIFYLIQVKQMSFIMALVTVTTVFWSITAVVMLLFREKIYDGLRKLPKERKERLLLSYSRQHKLYKFILWQSPLYVIAIFLIYKYVPTIQLNFINIVVIAIAFYLGAISSVSNKKYVITRLKKN